MLWIIFLDAEIWLPRSLMSEDFESPPGTVGIDHWP
jgi:hypothetical protein